jgi:hypothetical protein
VTAADRAADFLMFSEFDAGCQLGQVMVEFGAAIALAFGTDFSHACACSLA